MLGRLMGFLAGVMLWAGPAMAQQVYLAPDMKKIKEESGIVEWGIGAIFLVGCMVVAFKPAKRSNLR